MVDDQLLFSNQLMTSLSGGDKIKIQRLRILMSQPNLLLLDEPSNNLDLETIQWLAHFIQFSPLTVLFISHDTYLLETVTTGIIHIERFHKTMARTTFAR